MVILRLLRESGVALSKRGIQLNLDLREEGLSYSTIKDHVNLCVAAGYIKEADEKGKWYRITSDGRRLLDASELENESGSSEDAPDR